MSEENEEKKGPIVEMTRPEEEKDPQGDVQLLPEDVPAWIQTLDQAAHPENWIQSDGGGMVPVPPLPRNPDIDAHGNKKRIEMMKNMGLIE